MARRMLVSCDVCEDAAHDAVIDIDADRPPAGWRQFSGMASVPLLAGDDEVRGDVQVHLLVCPACADGSSLWADVLDTKLERAIAERRAEEEEDEDDAVTPLGPVVLDHQWIAPGEGMERPPDTITLTVQAPADIRPNDIVTSCTDPDAVLFTLVFGDRIVLDMPHGMNVNALGQQTGVVRGLFATRVIRAGSWVTVTARAAPGSVLRLTLHELPVDVSAIGKELYTSVADDRWSEAIRLAREVSTEPARFGLGGPPSAEQDLVASLVSALLMVDACMQPAIRAERNAVLHCLQRHGADCVGVGRDGDACLTLLTIIENEIASGKHVRPTP